MLGSCRKVAVMAWALLALAPQVRADILSENGLSDAANFAVLYTGGGGNTFNTNSTNITGNIGIAGTGKYAATGPGTITGIVEFAAASSGQFSSSNTTYVPSLSPGVNPTYNNGNVQTDINNLNTLSTTYAGESGFGLGNLTATTTINASAGTLHGSDRVFTVGSVNLNNSTTLTINGNGTTPGTSQNVVLNITGNNPNFNGTILLTGGLTSDQVLINVTGTNSTLTISANGATSTGIFLDPNGPITVNHAVVNGRLFGGDSHNMQVVSGVTLNGPSHLQTQQAVPEPNSAVVAALVGLTALGGAAVRTLRRRSRCAQPSTA